MLSLFPAVGGGGARPWPGFLLLPTDPQNQHKVQKISSLWFDFSPFCLWWTSRQSVFVFSSWARVGGSFERSGSRTGDLCSPTPSRERVPSSPYTSPTTWNSKQRLWTGGGDKSQPTGKTSFANLQISCICLWVDGSQRRVIAGKELHNSGGPRPRLLPATPTPTWTFAEKISDMVTIVWPNKNNGNELCCNSSTVKDDVSALFWVFGFHLNKVLRRSTAQEESDI